MNNFRTFFFSLSAAERCELASMAGTSVKYIQQCLVLPDPENRKRPGRARLKSLTLACEYFLDAGHAAPSHQDLVVFFYTEPSMVSAA